MPTTIPPIIGLLDMLEKAERGSRALSDDVLHACGWSVKAGIWRSPCGTTFNASRPDPTLDLSAALDWVVPAQAYSGIVQKRQREWECYVHNGEPHFTGFAAQKNPALIWTWLRHTDRCLGLCHAALQFRIETRRRAGATP